MELAHLKNRRFTPVFTIGVIAFVISFLTRLALLIAFGKQMHLSGDFFLSFFIGMVYDLLIASFIMIPFALQVGFSNEFIYSKTGRLITIILALVFFGIFFFTKLIPKEFNKDLFKWISIYLLLRFAIYLFLCTRSRSFREKYRSILLQFLMVLAIFLLVFNAVSEYFFWEEFSGRYNFIAVDYLVYTQEVIGNIRESYPMPTIIACIALASLLIFLPVRKRVAHSVRMPLGKTARFVYLITLIGIPFLLAALIKPAWVNFSKNNYANELSGNGVYQFVQAYQNNELDFFRYYKTMPDEEAFRIVKKELGIPQVNTQDTFNLERAIIDSIPQNNMNVVMISVESLSADYMASFGNKLNITPRLDSLAAHSLFFTRTYASGTRTVRGLEALSLSIPPTPGQSIVKRQDNENMFSLGSVLRSKGYITQFLYGGFSYFDNMKYFFSHNGYDVIDRTSLSPGEIHHSNIWGVADEDLFTLTLKTLDSNYSTGRPFFSQVMTVSNHRPFTYPAGRIDISPDAYQRNGAVKYTDYAIGDFLKRASSKPWFNKTIFIIVADHCASSSGSVALPVTGYHIPLIIYSPQLAAQQINELTAQIDIPPTILGLLHISYKSKFFGRDVLQNKGRDPRAFISTYQGLGMIDHEQLVIQSPVKKLAMFRPDFATGNAVKEMAVDSIQQKAIAFYQVASWLIKHKKYSKSE